MATGRASSPLDGSLEWPPESELAQRPGATSPRVATPRDAEGRSATSTTFHLLGPAAANTASGTLLSPAMNPIHIDFGDENEVRGMKCAERNARKEMCGTKCAARNVRNEI